jgi:hypothetical protein
VLGQVAPFFTDSIQATSLKWLRRGDLYFERFYCWKKQDLQAGGRRVNMFEPEASFTRQDFFCYFFVSTDKKVSARAAYDFARF